MSSHSHVVEWTAMIRTHLPTLSKPQVTVLALGSLGMILARSGAMPVAWTILPANRPHAWRREWLRMLCVLWPAIPQDWTVIVLADRGLYAGWLFRRIVRLWLDVAVATLWLLSVEGMADASIPDKYAVGRVGSPWHATPLAARHAPAYGQCLSPGLDPDPGGAARP